LPDQIVTISIDELRAHWLETGLIVWERFEPVPNLLGRNDEGQGVLWLQRVLAELRFYDGSPTSLFDAETIEALRRFQSARGLVSDGVAGPLTQIAIYGELARYPVPRLSRADGRTDGNTRRRAEAATTETRRSSVASPPNSTTTPSVRPPAQGAARG
jgi:peptidoglycan hydrolase-like protein with peptidoglycan-binding domain